MAARDAYAALGAVEVLTVHPDHRAARKLVTDYAVSIAKPNGGDPDWPWPEPRLSYANAVLAEAIIGVGVALEAPKLWQQGLDLLAWLLDIETFNGHLSPTPVAGAGARVTSTGLRSAADRGGSPGRRLRSRCCRRRRRAVERRSAKCFGVVHRCQ